MRTPLPSIDRAALLLSGLLICAPAFAQSSAPADGAAPQVVTITGQVSSDLRPYSRYRPGIVEFKRYRHLAPAAELRFGMVTGSFPMKPLPLVRARLEGQGFWNRYEEDLPIVEDGWFTIPDVPDTVEARRGNASVVVSRRNGSSASWMIDVHTPGLPAQVYRLGDLRLECRVYLAIEWDV